MKRKTKKDWGKIATITIAIIAISSLGLNFYVSHKIVSDLSRLKYAEIKISKTAEDIMQEYEYNNLLEFSDEHLDKIIDLDIVNVGQSDTGKINLAARDYDIFEQSYSTFIDNLESGKSNETKLQFSVNGGKIRDINKFPYLAELQIRVRCTGCEKTKTEIIKICIYNETKIYECEKYSQ